MILWVFIALLIAFVILPFVGAAIGWVIGTFFVGLFIGALARLIIPGRQNIGALPTIACGLVGSLGGGAIGSALWGIHHHHHSFATFLIEIGIAAIAVLLWSAIAPKRASRLQFIVSGPGMPGAAVPPNDPPRSGKTNSKGHRVVDI